ncbi:type II secretion system protein [Aeoliella sp.]|uniref:type II secretion system protein n=1 Tax=Aeoliella sp. TaxID=2795800 RepID=UPI003CCBAE53
MKPSPVRNSHSAFTLVELLVVIGIIAALASLLLVAGGAAMRASREAAIKVGCTQLADGFQAYTNDVSGGAYPPNMCIPAAANPFDQFKRHFNKAFPKQREPDALLAAIATGVSNGNYQMNGTTGIGLSPYEAPVFWLGGFSDDPKYPISGPGGPSFRTTEIEDLGARTGFDFAQEQLAPKAADNTFDTSLGRYITYPDPRDNTVTRRINLWWYRPRNLTIPYAYFDTSAKPKGIVAYDGIGPIVALKTGGGNNYVVGNLRWANEGQCQILSAGLDDAWGDFANEQMIVDWTDPTATYYGLIYPDGPWTGDLADTITNFSTNRTLEDSQP